MSPRHKGQSLFKAGTLVLFAAALTACGELPTTASMDVDPQFGLEESAPEGMVTWGFRAVGQPVAGKGAPISYTDADGVVHSAAADSEFTGEWSFDPSAPVSHSSPSATSFGPVAYQLRFEVGSATVTLTRGDTVAVLGNGLWNRLFTISAAPGWTGDLSHLPTLPPPPGAGGVLLRTEGIYPEWYTPDEGVLDFPEEWQANILEWFAVATDPESKDDCKNGGWEDYGFKNQGQCVRFVETGKDSR